MRLVPQMSDLPPWLNQKRGKQKQNRRSKTYEEALALEEDGRRQPGSGSSPRHPNDVKNATNLIEHKYTDRDSFSVNAPYFLRLLKNARDVGREGFLVVDFERHGLRIKIEEY